MQPGLEQKYQLTSKDLHQFNDRGYLLVPQLFSSTEVHQISEAIGRLEYLSKSLSASGLYQGSQFVFDDKKGFLKRVVWAGGTEPALLNAGRDERIVSNVGKLMGCSELDHIINQVHMKYPDPQAIYPYHQDSTHRRYGTNEWSDINGKGSFMQVFIAIDECTLENGPISVIPYSHRNGHLNLPYKETEQTLSNKFCIEDAIQVLMNPGDVLFFGPFLIHGSHPNLSLHPRKAFINGYAYPGANKRLYPGAGVGQRIRATR